MNALESDEKNHVCERIEVQDGERQIFLLYPESFSTMAYVKDDSFGCCYCVLISEKNFPRESILQFGIAEAKHLSRNEFYRTANLRSNEEYAVRMMRIVAVALLAVILVLVAVVVILLRIRRFSLKKSAVSVLPTEKENPD